MQLYLSIKNCLLAKLLIVDGEYVIEEYSTKKIGKVLYEFI